MAKTLEDILKNEKPEVVAEAKRIADEMLKKIHDSDGDSAKTDSDLSN
tara:strand:- start:4825 stop:4968 length:144 start_codon:yes stop_codon:yes gene_type:complete